MNVQEIIREIQDAAGPNGSQKQVYFRAMLETGVATSKEDSMREVVVNFNDCSIKSHHPNNITIILT